VVIDLFSRQVVGFSMNERMTRQLVVDALRMAWFRDGRRRDRSSIRIEEANTRARISSAIDGLRMRGR